MLRASPLLSLILAWSTCGVCTRVAHAGDACPHERTPRTRRRRSPRATLYPERRVPTTVEDYSLSLFLSRFSRGSAHPSVHHPGCRRVTMPPERYAPLLQHRATEEHLANINTAKSKHNPPARSPIACSGYTPSTPPTFVASLKFVQVRELKFSSSCDKYVFNGRSSGLSLKSDRLIKLIISRDR